MRQSIRRITAIRYPLSEIRGKEMSLLPIEVPIAESGRRVAECGVDVSVCIVNWNCRAHLRACLQSLRAAAEEVSLEVLVVDNGSSDGAADMTAELFPEVVLIRNGTNAGFSRGNNQAA
jgi:hypothetical protein